MLAAAQFDPGYRLHIKAKVISDSGTIKGYYFSSYDSTIVISSTKNYFPSSAIKVPVNSVRSLQLKHRTGVDLLGTSVVGVVGFILTAGLTKNGGDVDNDGKTSFWELIFTAIEGATSGNKRRRKTALLVGGCGAGTFMLAYLLTNKSLFLSFPINNRANYFREKQSEIYHYIGF